MDYKDITRTRSNFWIRVFANEDDAFTCLTNEHTHNLIDILYPEIEELSPKGWSSASGGNYHLWIPEDRANSEVIEEFTDWAERANQHIWLQKNKNIGDYFSDELDFCLAYDWNIDFVSQKRTEVGEAEYQLKFQYSKGHISEEEASPYFDALSDALLCCCEFLPINSKRDLFVTAIPAIPEEQNKLAWAMADFIQQNYGGDFLTATLLKSKPQIKSLGVNDRLEIWEYIYKNNLVQISAPVQGKTVLIVDDLYQSGVTMWYYAQYLKEMGARKVVGLVAVKAQKDRGNI